VKNFLLFLFPLSFFILGLVTISDYNVNWDEPEHFIRGQAYLRYFLHRETNYTSLPFYKEFRQYIQDRRVKPTVELPRYSIYQDANQNGSYYLAHDSGHPPLNDILAALSNYIFYQKLGIVGDIEAYHVFNITVSSIVVLAIFFWIKQEYGLFASIITVLSLVLQPLFFAESHMNIKDPAETAFFTLSLYMFYLGIKDTRRVWILVSALFSGMALATKLNVVFLPLIVIPWFFVYYGNPSTFVSQKKLLLPLLLYPLVVFFVFFITWPYLWLDPIHRILQMFQYYKGIGTAITNTQPSSFYIMGINTYPWQTILYTTPLIILFLSLVGLLSVPFVLLKERSKVSFLIVLWFFTPIVRATLPGSSIYGGIRQIMEYMPAMAMLAGIGGRRIVMLLQSQKTYMRRIAQVGILFLFLPIIAKMISIHPHENVYFNSLIGGLSGAKEKNYPYWGFNLGSSYLSAVRWLNKHAEKNAKVGLVIATATNIPKIYFREDIEFHNGAWSGSERKGEYLIEAVYNGWIRDWYYAGEYVDKVLLPVYEVKVDDVAIVKVWKNDDKHAIEKYLHEKELDATEIMWKKDQENLFITLKHTYDLMGITINYRSDRCQPFEKGSVFLSLDRVTWHQEREPIRKAMNSEGRFLYPIVAKKAKYVKIAPQDTSCTLTVEGVGVTYVQ